MSWSPGLHLSYLHSPMFLCKMMSMCVGKVPWPHGAGETEPWVHPYGCPESSFSAGEGPVWSGSWTQWHLSSLSFREDVPRSLWYQVYVPGPHRTTYMSHVPGRAQEPLVPGICPWFPSLYMATFPSSLQPLLTRWSSQLLCTSSLKCTYNFRSPTCHTKAQVGHTPRPQLIKTQAQTVSPHPSQTMWEHQPIQELTSSESLVMSPAETWETAATSRDIFIPSRCLCSSNLKEEGKGPVFWSLPVFPLSLGAHKDSRGRLPISFPVCLWLRMHHILLQDGTKMPTQP